MDSRDRIDELLARGRLSAPRRERMFEAVYARARPRRGGWRPLTLLAACGAAAAVAIVAGSRGLDTEAQHFRAKGAGHPVMEVGCSEGPMTRCPRGATLVFKLDGAVGGFLHAYATAGDGRGDRIWYFPTGSTPAPRIDGER